MIKKIAIALIVLSIVVIGVLYFMQPDPEPLTIPHVAEPTTSRITTEGEYVGFVDQWGTRAWLGISYATPPIGDRRWKAPIPPQPFEGIQTALEFSNPCVQLPNVMVRGGSESDSGVVGDEDCLYLNIWSPPNSINSPVMVWIHGGGNSTGEAGTYNGATLAGRNQIVVVTINYRLGLLGWFNHPAILNENQQRSGNFGNLDIVRSLEWVQDNIRSFGGDPSNVTVFGESAGGTNILALLVAPQAKDLVHRAIVQSGSFSRETPLHGYELEELGGHEQSASQVAYKLLVQDKQATNAVEAKELLKDMTATQLHQFLMAKSPAEIYATFSSGGFGGMVNFPSLFSDNVVVPSGTTTEIFGDKINFHDIPVVLGTNRDEPTIFMFQSPMFLDNFLGIFPRLKDENDYRRIVYYLSQEWRVRGVDSIAQAMTNAGHEQVYAYRFDWDEEPSTLGFDLSVALGAGHLVEVPFVFGDFLSPPVLQPVFPMNKAQVGLSDRMMAYWAEFARAGDPGTGRLENGTRWLSYGSEGYSSIVFDTEEDGGIQMTDATITLAELRDELLADTSFNDKDMHCRTYVLTLLHTELFSETDYESLGCAHLPPDEVSWN